MSPPTGVDRCTYPANWRRSSKRIGCATAYRSTQRSPIWPRPRAVSASSFPTNGRDLNCKQNRSTKVSHSSRKQTLAGISADRHHHRNDKRAERPLCHRKSTLDPPHRLPHTQAFFVGLVKEQPQAWETRLP